MESEHLWGNKMMYLFQIILSLCFYHPFFQYDLILIQWEVNQFMIIKFSLIESQLYLWETNKYLMMKFFFNHIWSILNQFVFKKNYLIGNLSWYKHIIKMNLSLNNKNNKRNKYPKLLKKKVCSKKLWLLYSV